MSHVKKYIIYKRLSKESKNGANFGLDSQQTIIDQFLERHKGPYTIVDIVEEIETGTRKKVRPLFAEAVNRCKQEGATLLIAKLDRLTRYLGDIIKLQESKVDFLALDLVDANPLTIHIFAAFAQHEAERISERTKAGLAVARKAGKILGSSAAANFSNQTRRAGRDTANSQKKQKAEQFAYMTAPRLQLLRRQGSTLQAIANKMNALKHPMPSGQYGTWTATTVRNCLKTANFI